jgi:protein-tyrosine phosphatase
MRSFLFVCTANICRSPMAEGVFRSLLTSAGVEKDFDIDSVGTHDYHVGAPPFPLAAAAALHRGYEIKHLVARRIRPGDFDHFDAILAMDRGNVATLKAIAPTRSKHKIELLLAYGDRFYDKDVPDPYGGQAKDFERALDMIEDGCKGLAGLVTRTATARR